MIRCLALLPLLISSSAFGQVVSGIGQSIDGDSLRVGDTEVRLFGIDAPESAQTCLRNGRSWACGSEAGYQLSKLVDGKSVLCNAVGGDTFGRTLARCRVGQLDVNRTMVAMGFALAYRRYSMDYVSAEESAKVSRRGIWSGSFDLPSEFRHAGDDYVLTKPPSRRERPSLSSGKEARSNPQPTGPCRIKGNHSRRGDWIYHLPGMPYYEQTRAEQMFCTEAEAQAAGYRRSRADQHR